MRLTQTIDFWTSSWKKHFEEYAHHAPLQAFYLSFILQLKELKLLEIAAGSFHDTACLNSWGGECLGIDSCPTVLAMARQQYPHLAGKISRMNAERLGFRDKAFDLSYHNGFFVYFEDRQIRRLLEEQTRVTRRILVCSVHNQLNTFAVRKFDRLSRRDALYRLRFFHPDEMRRLLKPYCREVMIFPFNIPEFDHKIAAGRDVNSLKTEYLHHYSRAGLERGHRLMAVGYL